MMFPKRAQEETWENVRIRRKTAQFFGYAFVALYNFVKNAKTMLHIVKKGYII